MTFFPRIAICAAFLLGLSGLAIGQAFSCTTGVAAPPSIRSDGEAEPVADVILTCIGGTPTGEGAAVPQVNITLFLNTNVTSRLLAQGFSEALLLVDEPTSIQSPCITATGICSMIGTGSGVPYDGSPGRPNVFQAQSTGPGQLTFFGFPLDPPANKGQRILRITNLKVNALSGANVTVGISINGPAAPALGGSNPVTAAFPASGIGFSSANVQSNVTGLTQFTLVYTERFTTVFKTRTAAAFVDNNTSPAPASQSVPGAVNAGSETGFYNPAFPTSAPHGNLSLAGLADTGTRLMARISTIPSGGILSAPLTVNIVQGNSITGVARLVNTDTNGVGVFSAAASTTLPVANGVATAVYEVLRTAAASLETVSIPITISNGAMSALTINGSLAPVNSVTASDLSSPAPRFNNPIQINVAASGSSLSITTPALPAGTAGSSYSATMTAAGGTPPYSWSATGFPGGVSINTAGAISGTPAANSAGNYSPNVTVTDSSVPFQTKSTQFPLTINPALAITTTTLPTGMVGVNYSRTLAATGGVAPYTFSLLSSPFSPNQPPPGLTVGANGAVAGLPTTASTPGPPFSFTVLVTDSKQNEATGLVTVTIVPPLVITTLALPQGSGGALYNQSIAASGGTTPYTFVIISGSAPNGLNLSATGVLSGTPTVTGTFSFTVQVTDNLKFTASQGLRVIISAAAPLLQVFPLQLSFVAIVGGDASPPQHISIVPSGATPVSYAVLLEGSTPNSPPPAALTVTPRAGVAPGSLTATVDAGNLPVGKYSATIHVLVPNAPAQAAIDVLVTLTITTANPVMTVAPRVLRYRARVNSGGTQDQFIVIRNGGGGGAFSFTATVVGKSPWVGVTPGIGQTAPNIPAFLRASINTTGLAAGIHHDIIRLSSLFGSLDIPISVFVQEQGPILSLSAVGLRFQARQGQGLVMSQAVDVQNVGDSTSIVNWQAEALSGGDWLTLVTSRGTATTGQSGSLVLAPNAATANFAAGPRYALVRVSDSNALGSPQYLVAVLDIAPANSPPLPDRSVGGMFFTTVNGAPPQSFQILVSSTASVPFQIATSTEDGVSWLTATPVSGSVNTQSPVAVNVSVSAASLVAGIYNGEVNVALGGVLRGINVTFIVPPSFPVGVTQSSQSGFSPQPQATGTCVASKLSVTQTGLTQNFAVPAGWPATLIVQLNDDCGFPVRGGYVVASFSNGDPPLSLPGDLTSNVYSATWQPGVTFPEMTVTVNAAAGGLAPAMRQFSGAVNQNDASPPSFYPGGTLHIFFDIPTTQLLGSGLAPGNVIAVYGQSLVSSTASPPSVPLPPEFNGTFMAIGPSQAPIYGFCSHCTGPPEDPTQLDLMDVQVPFELTPNHQYQAVVSANGALTLPETIDVVPIALGVAIFPGTSNTLAQHFPSYQNITAASPAKPEENVIIYLAGMGATNPPVASGVATPLQRVDTTVQPSVTLDGQPVSYGYAGLTPTGVGLYQINFVVPNNARSGALDLVITQGGITSNTTKLFVAAP